MEMEELLSFISMQNKRLQDQFPEVKGDKKILAQTVKLSEEVADWYKYLLCGILLERGNLG